MTFLYILLYSSIISVHFTSNLFLTSCLIVSDDVLNILTCSAKFTAEISENEIPFLDTVVFKGERLEKQSILDIKTQYKPTETFQYTHFNSCHPPGVKNGFIKGEAMRLLRTNSSKTPCEIQTTPEDTPLS